MEAGYSKQADTMSAKEQLIGMIDFLGENEAKRVVDFVRETFSLKPKTWDDIEEDAPAPDEITAFEEYRASP